MTISANYPSIRPSLLLDFASSEVLDSRITFSRPTTATYYDDNTSVVAEQNLFTYSQEFDNAYWTKSASTITANSIAAPDGTTTADTFTENTGTSLHWLGSPTSISLSGTASVTVSAYVKVNGRNFFQLWIGTGNPSIRTRYDVSTVSVFGQITTGGVSTGQGGTITSVGNGWYRVTATGLIGTTGTYQIGLFLDNGTVDASYNSSYTGDGTSGVYIWGAQLEQRSSVTAYNATTTTAITNYIPVLQTAVANDARFDHNPTTRESLGLLIEEQRTNLVTYSADFSNAVWTKNVCTIATTTNIAPDGTQTANTLTATAGAGYHYIYRNTAITISGSNTCTFYVKQGTATWIWFSVRDNSFNYFNVSTGAFGTTPDTCSVQSVGNGWYRITTTKTETSGTTSIGIAGSNGGASYTATGYETVFIWGAQLEAGAFATSYIPTVASQVTRSADVASMTGTNFSSWYNNAEGTIYSEATLSTSGRYFSFDNGATGTNQFEASQSGSTVNLFVFTNSAIQMNTTPVANAPFTANKVSFAYKTNDCAGSINAGTVSSDTSVILPTVANFRINNYLGNPLGSGTIKKIAYYPIRVTNAQLQGLTG